MTQNPLAAYLPTSAPAAQAPQSANPLASFLPAAPVAAPGEDRSVGQYLGEMIGNVPSSAAGVAGDLWDAISSPIDTAKALGGAVIGGAQLLKDERGIPTSNTFGDQRDQARAVGDYYSQRYGGGDEFLDSLRSDPVGVGLDVGGLVTGGAGAAARVPGIAGRLAKAVASKVDPVAAGGRVAGRAMDAQRRPRVPSTTQFIADAPSPDQLRGQGSALFEAAEKSGVKFKPAFYTKFVDDLLSRMVSEGADKILSPKVSRVADLLEKSKGRSPSIQQMSILRRQFGNAAGSADAAERRLASIAIDKIDDFVESGASAVGGTLGEARAMWSRLKKSETIDVAIENAQAAQAGVEAGLRAEFKSLYRARNTKKMRGFTAEELAAIKRVALGTATTNTLRRIGSLGGGLDQGRNMLNLMAGVAGGAAVGGPVGAALVPAAGYAAAKVSKARTSQSAALARAIAARGQTPRQAAVMPPSASAAARAVPQALEAAMRRYQPGSAPAAAAVGVGAQRADDLWRRRR